MKGTFSVFDKFKVENTFERIKIKRMQRSKKF